VQLNTSLIEKPHNKRWGFNQKRQIMGIVYITPWIIGFIALQLYPLIMSLIYSFSDYNMIKNPDFNGMKNYIYLFTKDPDFWQSLKVTLIYVFIGVPSKLLFALFIAMILNVKLRAVNFFRTVYYIPSLLGGSVSVAILWRFLFMRNGIVNKLLDIFAIEPVDWLGNPKIALLNISLLLVWQFGSSMVLFLAGLKQIPQYLYEAAKIDGASKPRMFLSITLPFLSPIIFFNLIMQTITTFQDFTAAFVITKGGPLKSTYLYGIMLYQNAFSYFKMGYASAQSWILFLVIMVFTGMFFATSRYWTYYEDGGKRL